MTFRFEQMERRSSCSIIGIMLTDQCDFALLDILEAQDNSYTFMNMQL